MKPQLKIVFLVTCLLNAAGICAGGELANLADAGFRYLAPQSGSGSSKYLRAISAKSPAQVSPGQCLLVEWTQPRDVREILLQFKGNTPAPDSIRLEWWRRVWPDNGSGGWMKLDDPFNGQWTRARVTADSPLPGQIRFTVAPLTAEEAPGIKRAGAPFRLTYKVRVIASQPVTIEQFAIHSQSALRRARLRFEWDLKTTVPGSWSPKFEARNGRILKSERAGKKVSEVDVEYAHSDNRLSADRGVVTFRSGELRSFSVFVDDVLREGGLFVRDLGVFVSDAERNLTYTNWPGPAGDVWQDGTIAEQVARMPEQRLDQVMRAIPQKPPNYLLLGVPNLRQEIALSPQGDVRLLADSLRSPGPDLDRRPWNWKELTYRIGSDNWLSVTGGKDGRTVSRRLENGWLPVVIHEWNDGEIAYVQTSVAAPLTADLINLRPRSESETVFVANRIQMKNEGKVRRAAKLFIEFNPHSPWRLEPDGMMVLEKPSNTPPQTGLTPIRGRFDKHDKGSLQAQARLGDIDTRIAPAELLKLEREAGQGLAYLLVLEPGESHAVDFCVPYIELLNFRELNALRTMSFERLHDLVVRYWQARASKGMTYEVPEKYLNEFFKANLWHVLISTDIDPATGQYQHGAATHHYKNYLNETMMVARSLNMRGEHLEAQRLIDTFLANQGAKGLPGNFKSQEGVLYAAHPAEPDPYTAQGYNMHHGWGMWGVAEHYYWTKDAEWLRRHGNKLLKAGDWITRERQATKVKNPDGSRPVEYGLAPAGDLEDVEEFLYWYATDAYYYLGMKHAAAALDQIGFSGAGRIKGDAEDFLGDLRESVAESVATTPVVRLKDGTYVPFVPPRVHALTHRSEGWIREGLYPALHLRDGEVYPDNHPFVDWMIQDLEDNIFLSQESGYGVDNPRANFFNHGGFTLQPNLVDLPIAYLKRDQVPNFLRGFYNTCGASLYPDAMCFAEWVPAFGKGGGPLYKTPDECKFIQWMRQMLILERGDTLELGLGVPRAWMKDGQRVKVERAATYFGKLDLEINSLAASGVITATIKLTKTESPKAILVRLRHPEGKPIRSAHVEGKTLRIDAARQLIELPSGAGPWEVTAQF